VRLSDGRGDLQVGVEGDRPQCDAVRSPRVAA
jgi:hypothetical protein